MTYWKLKYVTTSNRHDLSRGVIRCTVSLNAPLPAALYPVLAELAESVERAADKLDGLVESPKA